MRQKPILVTVMLLTAILFLPNVFAQGSTQFELPQGATARFGKGWVKDILFSPNGRELAVATTIGIWVYDVSTGNEKDLLRGPMGGANAIAYASDGRTLAAAHEDRTVYLWNTFNGRARAFPGHTGHIRAIAFSDDNSMVASGGTDNTIRIWDVHANRLRAILPGYTSAVSSIAFSSDSSMLAGGSKDGTIRVWDTGTGDRIYEFNGHTELVSGVIFLRDDSVLVSSSLDGTIRLWNLVSPGGSLSAPRQHSAPVHAVAFTSNTPTLDTDEYTFASGSEDRLIRVWNTTADQLVNSFDQNPDSVFDGHGDSVNEVRFSPDGRTLATASFDGTVRLWDMRRRAPRVTLTGHTGMVKALVYTPDNRIYACGPGLDGKLRLWDAGTGTVLSVIREHTGLTAAAAFSWDGKTLASGGLEDGKIFLSDVDRLFVNNASWNNSTLNTILTGNSEGITALAFSPAGTTLASGGLDGRIHLLDIATRRELKTLRGPESTVTTLTFAGDGTFLASGEENRTLRYWNSLVGEEVNNFRLESRAIEALTFSPTSPFLAVGDAIGEIWLYDLAARTNRRIFTQHTRKITALVFSRDGRTLVSGSEDGTILQWDMARQMTPQKVDYSLKPHQAKPFIQLALNATVHLSIGNRETRATIGSGFFIDIGYVATNYHVIKGQQQLYVKSVGDQRRYTFEKIVVIDEKHDLAILRVSGPNPPILDLENSDEIEIGETIYTVGNPIGLEGTVSRGIVSSIRDFGRGTRIQIDAPTSPGNSGGPVLNEEGKVIGISASGYQEAHTQNLNFAVPSNYLRTLLSEVR
ncbi:MAG: trypsin-like peptidase domain-containing protein [Candidatus Poribacteria bacterium]|nr:trypsin-like peptidase domain-containing protein [Candidatus Poribacteria bacterium]